MPPLAGSGLFDYHSKTDHHILFHGPYEFRIHENPIMVEDDCVRIIELEDGRILRRELDKTLTSMWFFLYFYEFDFLATKYFLLMLNGDRK